MLGGFFAAAGRHPAVGGSAFYAVKSSEIHLFTSAAGEPPAVPAPPAVNCAAAAAMFERQEKHMPYAIMRAEKLKTFGNVAASLQHCFRGKETPNADAARAAR